MCCPSIKTLLIFAGFAFLVSLLVIVAGPTVVTVPMEKIRGILPTPHLTVTFSAVRGLDQPFDYAQPYKDAGFNVVNGKLVPLSNGTCKQCMGSPANDNPHFAVALPETEDLPRCSYNGTNDGICFKLRKVDAILIITSAPPESVFDAFSWGLYMYDRYDTGGRDLIQAPLYEPLRFNGGRKIALIISFLPELSDMLAESIQIPDIRRSDIYILPVPEDIVQSGKGPMNDDRLSILLKTVPGDEQYAQEFYKELVSDTVIMQLRVQDVTIAQKMKNAASYSNSNMLGYLSGKVNSEISTFGPLVAEKLMYYMNTYNVELFRRMVELRELLGVHNVLDCINKDINCLAEDWDVTYTVSDPLVFPNPPNYKILILGVDHAEATMTTLGLFESLTNQEVLTLPRPDSSAGIYTQWLARDCSQTPQPCLEIPHSIAPGAKTLYLRERVYGINNYEKLVAPIVLKIKE